MGRFRPSRCSRSPHSRTRSGARRHQQPELLLALMADGRRAWSSERIAKEYFPENLSSVFRGIAPNAGTLIEKFMLNKDLLRARINYRVFQLTSASGYHHFSMRSDGVCETGRRGQETNAHGAERNQIGTGAQQCEENFGRSGPPLKRALDF